ncbi:hypothetical protein ACQPZG_15405 [Streptomyces sp. CA-294286]|uniref:hypothetical protein n=1 Tax=Streptomyces sp. CA-294286 TaxID=3240070 RepID=UPI003D8AB1F7
MAFSADELRVLRSALALALHPAPLPADEVRECLRLAESVDEAIHEAGRLRAFLLADLARYRVALPGSAGGYLELLQDALAAGYRPLPDDLVSLRSLRSLPLAAALLARCQGIAERSVRARLAHATSYATAATAPAATAPAASAPAATAPAAPAPRTRLTALPGGLAADAKPSRPAEPAPREPVPADNPAHGRPVPTPAEAFPPRKRPTPPGERREAS